MNKVILVVIGFMRPSPWRRRNPGNWRWSLLKRWATADPTPSLPVVGFLARRM